MSILQNPWWSDLCKAYAQSHDQPNSDSFQVDEFVHSLPEEEDPEPNAGEELIRCESKKYACLEYSGGDYPPVDQTEQGPVKDMHINTTELKDGSGKEKPIDGKLVLGPSEDSIAKNKNSETMTISHEIAKGCLEENASGLRSSREKSNRGTRLSNAKFIFKYQDTNVLQFCSHVSEFV